MALLLKDNMYLRIDRDGNYIIYKNKTARNVHKKATSSDEVLAKYNEIILSFYSPERSYYDAENLIKEVTEWSIEEERYDRNLQEFNYGEEYPLMAQYIPDVKNTIPKAIETGRLGLADHVSSVKELYAKIKEYKIFGECEDA